MKSGQIRAVKILRKEKLSKFDIDRLSHEVEIMKRLDHPNILKIYELYEDEKRFYLVMEICAGGELFDELQLNEKLDESIASIYTEQILTAVAYLHKHCIVHRDIKPENILIEERKSYNIKLIDFGASEIYDDCLSEESNKKLMKNVFGSAYYIAPEVLSTEYDEKCDMWSIGVLLYIMLTGSPPFPGNSELEIVHKVKLGLPEDFT